MHASFQHMHQPAPSVPHFAHLYVFGRYNEVAFLALSEVAPVTHAVGNTIKRVVIILASVIVFQNPLLPLGALGSAIAVGGCVNLKYHFFFVNLLASLYRSLTLLARAFLRVLQDPSLLAR